jgi:hypothetical protein
MTPADLVDEILDSLSIGDNDDDDEKIEAALKDMRLALYVFDISEKRLFTTLQDNALHLHLGPGPTDPNTPNTASTGPHRQLPTAPSPLVQATTVTTEPASPPKTQEDSAQEEQLHSILDRIAAGSRQTPAGPSNPLDRLTKSQASKLLEEMQAEGVSRSMLESGLQQLGSGAGRLWGAMGSMADRAYEELEGHGAGNDDNGDNDDEADAKAKAARAVLDRMSQAAGKPEASREGGDCAVIM